jgi:alpha-glucosidase
MLLALRGTPVLYFGDEIGLPDVPVPPGQGLDPAGRDPCRTPMPWESGPGAGFTAPGVRPWLPLGDARSVNVADQRADPASTLNLCRDAIALRQELPALRTGDYESLDAPDGVWAWRRGGAASVALNLSDEAAGVGGIAGTIRLGTDRAREGERVAGSLALGPWEGAIVA